MTDANNGNYLISYNSRDFAIDRRAVTVTADAGQGKTYGNADPSSYTYSHSSLGSGVALNGALDRAAGENVGAYAIGQGGVTDANNGNYLISYNSRDFAITPAAAASTTRNPDIGILEIAGIQASQPHLPSGGGAVEGLNALPGTAAGGEGNTVGAALVNPRATVFTPGRVSVAVCGISLPDGVTPDSRCQ